jgi:ABC-type branched-subunit amino acid transport system ATPase component
MELFENMTVRENVRTGPEALFSSNRFYGLFICSRKEGREIRDRADEAIERCGITQLASQTVGDLSTGQRRLVELARAMATPFKFLLLDEPSSGLDHSETGQFGQVLLDFVSDTGTGILLIEHDMSLVAEVCALIFVLDFGRMIYTGTTSDALVSPVVKAAYLGEVAVAGA